MASVATCPVCGSAAGVEKVAGHCPACLVGIALSADETASPASATGFSSTSRQFGDYLLGNQIGAGGMGVVYEARRLPDQERVALKLIRDLHTASPALVCRFTIEAEAVARLDHPNIVRVHEIGEADGHPFFSMDFVDGEGLDTRIARGEFNPARGRDPLGRQKEMAQLMAKVARAVHHAHSRGVAHRDLKPANILIDATGEPRLTDFGLAKLLQRDPNQPEPNALTTSGVAPGTPGYMAPEQVAGGDVGIAADIYGLGAVLYAMLTGRPPFQGATPLELFQQITQQPPVRPRSIQPRTSEALETIVLKCLEKEAARRYGSAAALADDLDRFAAGRRIQARPPGLAHRTQAWVRRNPVGAALILSLCLGLLVALALLKVVNDQRREMEADRDQTFDEGMQKVSQIWRDPATRAVTISARELAILAERSPAELRGARHQFTLGVSADDSPATMAQRYARWLGRCQEEMSLRLGEKVIFHLRLLKRFSRGAEVLASGEVDFLVLGATEFLDAQQQESRIQLIARTGSQRQGVIFAHTRTGARQLADLRGRILAFPDANQSLAILAKARFRDAGFSRRDFRAVTNLADPVSVSVAGTVGTAEIIELVLRGEADAGVTHRAQFERTRHLGLVALDEFAEEPGVLAAKADLDAKLTAALRDALAANPVEPGDSPEVRFSAVANESERKGTLASLETFRQAIQQARKFDGLNPGVR